MFMLRGIPFVDLAYLHKRDLQEIPCPIGAGRRDGHDRLTDAGGYANGENDSKQGQGLSLFIPHITK